MVRLKKILKIFLVFSLVLYYLPNRLPAGQQYLHWLSRPHWAERHETRHYLYHRLYISRQQVGDRKGYNYKAYNRKGARY